MLAIFIGGAIMSKEVWRQLKIRLTEDIYEEIKRSAKANMRSISAEVSYRLLNKEVQSCSKM
jgi:hypothetical protein